MSILDTIRAKRDEIYAIGLPWGLTPLQARHRKEEGRRPGGERRRMIAYADTPSQQARQFDADAALSAAEVTRRRAETMARLRAVHAARQADTAARRAMEERGNYAAVKTGTDYERFVATVLESAGYTVRRVGQSGDYGADILVTTSTGTAVIQCKFYSHPVGYDAVKEAYTAEAIYHATAAYVVSNAAFTTQARRAARQLGVTIAHHAKIVELLYLAESR